MTTPPEFLAVQEVAALFHCSTSALYTQRHRGEAPGALAVKVGRKLLFRRSDLDAWWNQSRTGGSGAKANTNSR